MTDLKDSPVSRRTTVKHRDRRLLVTLTADDRIVLRHERERTSVSIPIIEVLLAAQRRDRFDL